MATPTWSVVILDNVSDPPFVRQQELVSIGAYDAQKSSLRPSASPKPRTSKIFISFPLATPDLSIREMMQVWAGYRDGPFGPWLNDPPPFGGYITRLKETTYGGEKTFELDVSDYSILLQKTTVLGWPTFVTNPYVQRTGYPPGQSVRDWLIGRTSEGLPFDGLLNQHLGNGVNFGGVDPFFDEVIFGPDVLPGLVDVLPGQGVMQGYFGFISLDKAIQQIADATYFAYAKNYSGGPDLIIGYWMSALALDWRIVPRFEFRNVADLLSAPDLVIAADADPDLGEVQMYHPHYHERIADKVQTRTVFLGIGGDPTLPGNPLTYAEFTKGPTDIIYPTDYQLVPGWAGEPILETRLWTIELARLLAEYVGQRVWGAQGSISFEIDVPVQEGMRILLRDPNEAENRLFIVQEVEDVTDTAGHPRYHVQVGFTQLTIQDVMKGGLPDVLLTMEDLKMKELQSAGRAYPGQEKQLTLDTQPATPFRNYVTTGYVDVPAATLQGTLNLRPDVNGVPIPAPLFPVPVFNVKPPATPENPTPADGTWVTRDDGRPHPQEYHFGRITAAGTYGTVLRAGATLSMIVLKGVGTVSDLLLNNVSVPGLGQPWVATDPTSARLIPFDQTVVGAPGDDIDIVVSAVTGYLKVVLVE